MGFVTVKDLARELGYSPDRVRKKIRSFMRFNNIPPSRVLVKEKGAYKYVLDEKLYEEFKRFCQPKIRIKVKIQ